MLFKSGFIKRSGDTASDDENKEKRSRQRLVVHTKEGKILYGFSLALNKNNDSFHLDLLDKANQSLNKSVSVSFAELKALFYVKSFDGRFDPAQFPHAIPEEAIPLVIQFKDGEIISGFSTSSRWMEEARFYFIPEDKSSNNLGILVERSAMEKGMTPEEYRRHQHHAYEKFMAAHENSGFSKHELLGDFYFQEHQYVQSLKHYQEAREADPNSPRIRKKLCTTYYNVGVCHVRQHDYERALRFMERVLALDSTHEQAQKRAQQLRTHLSRSVAKSDPPPW